MKEYKYIKRRKIQGIGINDADYPIHRYVNNKIVWRCPYYKVWSAMMRRCYSEKVHLVQEFYRNCTVDQKWHRFSNFKKWMETQDWEGKQLDKDLLIIGNTVYSEETCVFLEPRINKILVKLRSNSTTGLQGAYFDNSRGKYDASYNGKHLGRYDCKYEAHEAWRACKHKELCNIAAQQKDTRIANALAERMSYQNWYKDGGCKVEEKTY